MRVSAAPASRDIEAFRDAQWAIVEFPCDMSFRHLILVQYMRSEDMHPGEGYALLGSRRTKVTVLDTPPEVRRLARVRVRFETGVKAGEVIDVPSRRIAGPWDGREKVRKPASRRRARLVAVDRPPEVGDLVTCTDTGGLI
jgi:hypothetical protein